MTKPNMTTPRTLPPAVLADYQDWLKTIKQKIHATRMKVALAANGELIALYYEIGAQIVDRESHAQWGSGFIDAFSHDLRAAFPDLGGFSSKNLRYCRAFFRFYCDPAIWQQAVAKLRDTPWAGTETELSALLASIPWGHTIQIFTKCSSVAEARYYIEQTLEQGWSRDVLALQLKSNLYTRAGKAVTNFARTLPSPQSDLAQQTLKDPYTFDFMTMTAPYNELDVERKLTQHITQFLLELGKGDKNNIEVEFALRDMNKPMGVSEYTLVEALPDNLKGAMPTVEEIESELKGSEGLSDGHQYR